ncbi:MAG: hypothetical protein IK017_01385 [Paludibacteraceae bacterium]|nr:hypothetical protein [Paludibacteraceae bacterium]
MIRLMKENPRITNKELAAVSRRMVFIGIPKS